VVHVRAPLSLQPSEARPVDAFVVEDSHPMRHLVIEALEELRAVRVVGVSDSADEAIREIRSLKPHFVVLDLRLAQGSGLSVLEAVKRLEPPPVVAVLTNYPLEQYRVRCAQLGADFFFDKAAGLDDLLEAVRRVAGVERGESACA
jgi:DNA-binding NarL/FixJ family response regulator